MKPLHNASAGKRHLNRLLYGSAALFAALAVMGLASGQPDNQSVAVHKQHLSEKAPDTTVRQPVPETGAVAPDGHIRIPDGQSPMWATIPPERWRTS